MSSFITIKVVSTEVITAKTAREKGYRTNDCPDEVDGYEVFYEDGYKSWCPIDKFIDNAINLKPEYAYNLQCPAWAPAYLKRMYEEFDELKNKFIKLQVFVTGDKFKQLDEAQQHYLRLQYHFMNGYLNVLGHRIEYEYDLNQPCDVDEDCCGVM